MIADYLILAGASIAIMVALLCLIQLMFNHWVLSLQTVRTGILVAYGAIVAGLVVQLLGLT